MKISCRFHAGSFWSKPFDCHVGTMPLICCCTYSLISYNFIGPHELAIDEVLATGMKITRNCGAYFQLVYSLTNNHQF